MNEFVKIGIVGTGVMATGINKLMISKGIDATLINSRDLLDNKIEELDQYDLFIECVAEDFDLKIQVFENILSHNSNCVIATCTSSLSVSKMQQTLSSGSNLIGIHFMNPPTYIHQVELVPAEFAYGENINRVKSWLENLGQTVTIVPDIPGFVVNALLFALLNRAAVLLEESGLTPSDIDNLIVNVAGHKMGPLKTLDLIGIDTSKKILDSLYLQDPVNNLMPAKIFELMIEQGELGRKTKRGFFTY